MNHINIEMFKYELIIIFSTFTIYFDTIKTIQNDE